MSIFKKIFGGKSKEEKKEVKSESNTSFKTATMSASDLANLKVGDTISFGNPKEKEKTYEPKWIKSNENPYNIEVFDCREYLSLIHI